MRLWACLARNHSKKMLFLVYKQKEQKCHPQEDFDVWQQPSLILSRLKI